MTVRSKPGTALAAVSAIVLSITVLLSLAAPTSAYAQQTTRTRAIIRATTPPTDLAQVNDPTQVPRYASWHSLANPGTPPMPCFGLIHTLHPDWTVYWSPSLGAGLDVVWMDDTSLYAAQVDSMLSSPLRTMNSLSDTATGFGPDDLWAQPLVVTNDGTVATVNLIIFPPQSEVGSVFDVFYTPSLQEPLQWYWVYRTIPFETNIWAGGLGLDSGYFRIADTNGPGDPVTGLTAACMGLVGPAALTNDLNHNGIPDFWEVLNLPGLMPGNTDFDHDGLTISNEWAQQLSPNKLSFSLKANAKYATSQNAGIRVNVLSGVPARMGVAESTDFSSAVWMPFNPNQPLSLAPGWHELWVTLRGRTPDQNTPWKRVRFKVDDTPPVLVFTNPVSNLGPRPVVQLSGYSLKPLSSLTFSFTNDTGPVNGQALLLSRHFNTNQNELTTNWFRCLDVGPFTVGTNCVNLTATDLAGNVTQTNFIYVFTTNGTTPPVMALTWPTDGAQVSGGSFTLRASVDNETASVTAQIVDAAGNTNSVSALRQGAEIT